MGNVAPAQETQRDANGSSAAVSNKILQAEKPSTTETPDNAVSLREVVDEPLVERAVKNEDASSSAWMANLRQKISEKQAVASTLQEELRLARTTLDHQESGLPTPEALEQAGQTVQDEEGFHHHPDLRTDSFLDGGPMLEVVGRLLKQQYPTRADPFSRPLSEEDCNFLTLELRNYNFLTTHNPEFRRRYRISQFTARRADQIFLDGDMDGKSVADYFESRWGKKLDHPGLACVVVRKSGGPTYFPMEVCEIEKGQHSCLKYTEEREPVVIIPPTEEELAETSGRKKKKKNKNKNKRNASDADQNGDQADGQDDMSAGEAIMKQPTAPTETPIPDQAAPAQKKEHSFYRDRGGRRWGISYELWEHRKACQVCLRCGHPSHRLQDCALYDDLDGKKDWNDCAAYKFSTMEIPTKPKLRLSQKCNIPDWLWRQRRNDGVCCRCGHPGHDLKGCAFLQAKPGEGDYNGEHTWEDIPEYLADSRVVGDCRVPNGFVMGKDGRFWRIAEDGSHVPLEPPQFGPSREQQKNERERVELKDLPPVDWDEAGGESNVKAAEKGDQEKWNNAEDPAPAAHPAAPVVHDYGVDADGYTLLDPNGNLKKKVLRRGSGPLITPQSYLQVHYTGWVHGTDPPKEFDSSAGRRPFEYVHGDGQVLEAWEKAVSTMHVNEKSEIICGPEYAYGEEGYQPMVPGNATLCFHLEIVHAELPQDPVPQRIEEATTHKTRGNAHFKTGAYHLSQESYKAGLDRLRTTWGASVHDDMEIQKLRTALYSNLAEAYIRTLDASDAVRACEGGLAVAPQNTKMWYRLGRAKTMLKDWEGAQSALDTAEDLDRDDPAIKAAKVALLKEQQKIKDEEKKLYGKMLFGDSGDNTRSVSPQKATKDPAVTDKTPDSKGVGIAGKINGAAGTGALAADAKPVRASGAAISAERG